MIPESITLTTKGFFMIMGASALDLFSSVAQAVTELPDMAGLESLGTHGLLVLGIWYLHRANQKLEGDLRKMHEDQKTTGADQLKALKDELQESRDSRDRLYNAIRGSLTKSND